MKYITAVIGLILIAGCAHTSTNSAPVNIDGLWKGTFGKVIFGAPQELAFNFISDGKNVGGFMRNENQPGDWIKLENFIMKGDKIYFTTTANTSQGVVRINYEGRYADSVIKLAAKVERPGSSDNPLRGTKPSFRYEGRSGGVDEGTSNIVDQSIEMSGGRSKGTIDGGGITFTIRKVQ